MNEFVGSISQKIPATNAKWEIFALRRKVYAVEGKDLKVNREKNALKDFFAIRVIKNHRAGTSTCSQIEQIPEAFQKALNIAEITEPDECLSLPLPSQTQSVKVFDENLCSIATFLPDLLINMQRAAFYDKRVKKLRNAEITITVDEKAILNSEGLLCSQPFTSISAHMIAIAEDEDQQMGWAYTSERFLKNLQVENIGKEAASKAIRLLNSKKIKSFKGMVLFDPYVAGEFVELISQSLSGENYLLGRSIFSGKMGEKVINEKLDILDDGTIPERFGSTPFDAEGVPTSKKILIQKGRLSLIMHNTYTANRTKMISTGNAVRTERGITVGPTNLYIDTEEAKLPPDELIREIERGIYVIEVMGMHTANPVSGDFSVGISGIYIEKGEMKYPVRETVISGNLLQLFQNIVALGTDLHFYGNIGSPTLLVEGIDISG